MSVDDFGRRGAGLLRGVEVLDRIMATATATATAIAEDEGFRAPAAPEAVVAPHAPDEAVAATALDHVVTGKTPDPIAALGAEQPPEGIYSRTYSEETLEERYY